jgi:ACS family tartrate transporter-like MFS transporter
MRKLRIRIIPYIILLFVVSFLDRVNLGYAALEMNKQLAITSQQFGLVAGIFFIGYFIFEIPSNVLMHKFGARIWIARILITWGIVSIATMFANSAMHLYILRFLLGVAEAGFFPGIILYMTYWFPSREHGRAFALFMCAMPISNIIGAPLSGFILDHVHWGNYAGWQWMFLLEGLPAVVFGILTYFILPNRPVDAKWLTSDERTWLTSELEREQNEKMRMQSGSKVSVFRDKKVWLISIMFFCNVTGLYGIGFWMPQIVKGLSASLSNTMVGILVMIPYIVGGAAMILNGIHSDKTMERKYHLLIPPLVGAAGLVAMGFTHDPIISIVLLSIITAAIYCFAGVFWSMPNMFLTASTAAVGIALINSIGNLSGFVGPYIIGVLKDATGSVTSGLYFVAGSLVLVPILGMIIWNKKNLTSPDASHSNSK